MEQNIIFKVCSLPADFYRLHNKSMLELLKGSGYLENKRVLTEAAIIDELRSHPGFISDWNRYSEDNRSLPAWIFRQEDNQQWTVTYFNVTPTIEIKKVFGSAIEACAAYILIEVGEFQSSLESPSGKEMYKILKRLQKK
jgi:hypothetical protein